MIRLMTLFLLFSSSQVFAQYYPKPNTPNPYVKKYPSNIPNSRIGRPGVRGALESIDVGRARVDIYGNTYQRVSPRLGFINGQIQYRTASGWVTSNGFVPFADPTRWFNPQNYSLRFVGGETPERQRQRIDIERQRRQQRINAQRYRSTLPPQYNGGSRTRIPSYHKAPTTGRVNGAYKRQSSVNYGRLPAQYRRHPVYGAGR